MIGRILANRYEILEQLGGGGMAIVYKGRDNLLNRLVTVKVLRPEYTSDAEFVARFRREAQAVARLSHPNIVSIYDVGQEESIQFLVMEYVDGENLKTVIKRLGLLPAGDAVSIAVQIAEALEHAHENHIVHRDVKPHNILITRLGRAKLTDFGIAMEAQTGTVVNSGTVMGSVHYLSPEQARGEVAGPPSDIYSLGVVLYEMLSGAVPFTAETPVGVAMKHIQENPLPVTTVNATVPPGPAAVTARAMQKDPARRYAHAGDMARELTSSWQERAAPFEETVAIRENLVPAGAEVGAMKKRRRIKPAGWVVLLLLVAGLMAGAGYFLRNYLNVPEVQVPDVTGRTYSEAHTVMSGAGLRTDMVSGVNPAVPKGLVISQDPVAGALVKQNRVVTLTVSQGPQMVQVPDLTGMTGDAANTALGNAGLKMDSVNQTSATVPSGQVMGQTPGPGTSVPTQSHVTVDVSVGPQASIAVPDLTGLTLALAQEKLASLNLSLDQTNVGYAASTQYLHGQVVSQNPAPNTGVTAGTAVQVTLSSGPGPAPKDAQVNVNVPADGHSHLVRIVVQDVRGTTDAYVNTEPSGASVSRTVPYYGHATISAYIDGNLVGQQSF
ncbi:MAG: PASTA domain-containing protein [Peptococcaceae bacterium]|jgi:serine/threonine-protein kinase|nr:PASTA domain-containing protein [Peptococcaceae bacterium]